MKAIGVIGCVCIVLSTSAVPQGFPKGEVYGGYSYVNIDTNGLSSRQSANGWEASVSGNFNKWFGAEANVAGYYKTFSFTGVGDIKVTDYSYAAGPRFNVRPLFIHALIGGDHLTGSLSGVSESQDGLAGVFGGGVEFPVSNRFAVQGSVDYVFSRHNIFGGPSFTQNNVRASVGIAYRFGFAAGSGPSNSSQPSTPRAREKAVVRPSRSGLPISALGVVVAPRDNSGAEIREVASGSIAEMAGLASGDVINSVDGAKIRTPMELQAALTDRTPGTKIRVGYMVRGYWQSETVIILR